MRRRNLLTLLALAAVSACAWGYDDYYNAPPRPGPIAYRGQAWARPAMRAPYDGPLSGPGLPQLDEWLRNTPEGHVIVTLGFRDAARGVISEATADRANIWFRRYADTNHDLILTDPEIRIALVTASRRYMRRRD